MPNLFDSALSAVTAAYQSFTGSSPTVTFGSEIVDTLPGGIGLDPMYVEGGVAEGAQIIIQTRSAAWTTAPEKGDVVSLANHANAENGTYHVLQREDKEANIILTLGNFDAQQ